MLDFIKSFFGKGKLVYDVVFADGQEATVKYSFVGNPMTKTDEDEKEMIQKIELESGLKVTNYTYRGIE